MGTIALQPRHCRVAHAVRSTNLGQGFTSRSTAQGFVDLEWRQLGLATKPHASLLRAFSALRCPREDHAPFKLSQRAQHREDQLAMGAGGVEHRISDRAEACTLLSDGR